MSALRTLIHACRAVIHQRDFFADFGRYDSTISHPDNDQAFDDWAADLLQQTLEDME